MPKASEVANELRKLADGLDKEPDALIERPFMYFSHYGITNKASFMAIAKAIPRPFTKEYKGKDFEINYQREGIDLCARINRDAVCHIVEPAKPAVYKCEPILSQIEEESLI